MNLVRPSSSNSPSERPGHVQVNDGIEIENGYVKMTGSSQRDEFNLYDDLN